MSRFQIECIKLYLVLVDHKLPEGFMKLLVPLDIKSYQLCCQYELL